MKNAPLTHVVVGAAVVVLSGCASIISGRTASVQINSNPSHADVVIHDKHGREVLTTHTPATVELKRKDRLLWPARYTATIRKPGYQTAKVPIRSTVNPWVLGNVVFGGIPGLVVDSATGAGWKPQVASIQRDLEPIYTAQHESAAETEQAIEPASATY
jgi:uncharacterized protein YceK